MSNTPLKVHLRTLSSPNRKNMYISALPVPLRACICQRNTTSFSNLQRLFDLNMKVHFKTTRRKKPRIPPRTNRRRYVFSTIHGFSTLTATNKPLNIRSPGVSIVKTISSSIPAKPPPTTTRRVCHVHDMLPDQQRSGRRNTQVCYPRGFSRSFCCCCLSWSAWGHAARLIAIRTKPHRFRCCCRQPTNTPRPFPATANFSKAECTRHYATWLCPHETTLLVGCTRLAAVRLVAKCADKFTLVSDYTHVCFLLYLLLAVAVGVAAASAYNHAVRRKIPPPLRTARALTIEL